MKRYIISILLSVLTFSAWAQGYQIEQAGLIKEGDGCRVSFPSTAISVELIVEKSVVTPGIYARYAQKYLALRAPLVAQTTYNIIDASIEVAQSNTHAALLPAVAEVEHATLPVDQYSPLVLSAEDAARDAASAIFTIRRQRRDIINGEAGEGYFGAGLKDAIAALDKMEQEYLELFMGRKKITQSIERYVFIPQADAARHVVARFDQKEGMLSTSDLSGSPVYMQFNVQAFPDTKSIEYDALKKVRGSKPVLYRIAAPTQCILYNDSQVIASTIIPIFELGKDLYIETAYAK